MITQHAGLRSRHCCGLDDSIFKDNASETSTGSLRGRLPLDSTGTSISRPSSSSYKSELSADSPVRRPPHLGAQPRQPKLLALQPQPAPVPQRVAEFQFDARGLLSDDAYPDNSKVDGKGSANTATSDQDDSDGETYTVEEAVEKLGFGRFQLRILFICGIMTAADAMEMLLLSVLGPALRCDWRLTSAQVAIITTVVFAGMFAGAPAWGTVSDKHGRRGVFGLSLSLIAYFGLLCSFSPSFIWLVTLRGMVGFCISGAASSFTLLSEYLPQTCRAKVLIAYNVFWGVGSSFEVLLAYTVLPTLGWRYLTAFSALPLFIFMLSLGFLPESARYLLASGQPKRAAAIIDQIARDNRKPPMIGRPVTAHVTEHRQLISSRRG